MSDPTEPISRDATSSGWSHARWVALPIVNHFLERLGLPALLAGALPDDDGPPKLAPAVAIRLVVTNLVLGREPLYGLGEWAARYDPALLGLGAGDLAAAQRRPGRPGPGSALRRRPGQPADRGHARARSAEFGIDTGQLHNDSTSISRARASTATRSAPSAAASPPRRSRSGTPRTTVPTSSSWSGSSPSAPTGRSRWPTGSPTATPATTRRTSRPGTAWSRCWAAPTSSTSRTPSCARATAMGHIAGSGGRFVTVLPRSRAEDGAFREHLQTHAPLWTEAARRAGARLGDPDEVYSTTPAPTALSGGLPDRVGALHAPRPPGTPPAGTARLEAGGRGPARPSMSGSPAPAAGSRPASPSSRPRPRAGHQRPRRAVGHLHRHRDHHQGVQAGTRRPARSRDPLPRRSSPAASACTPTSPWTRSPTTPPATAASR